MFPWRVAWRVAGVIVVLGIAGVVLGSVFGWWEQAPAVMGAKSGEDCADKVALAEVNSKPVPGAWDCLSDSTKASLADLGYTRDEGLPKNLNRTKYMDRIHFVGRRSMLDSTPPRNPALPSGSYLYEAESNSHGSPVLKEYIEVQLDDAGRNATADTSFCTPQGDLDCSGLPN